MGRGCARCGYAGVYLLDTPPDKPNVVRRCKCNGGREYGPAPDTKPKKLRDMPKPFSHAEATTEKED